MQVKTVHTLYMVKFMSAKIVTVLNQKGGAGKSTLSMQLSGTFARRGFKCLVVDADPQGTSTRWAASAADESPFPASVVGLSAAESKVHREVKKFIDDYELIIIDCPPAADSPVPQSALLVSDLALVPVIPSPPDMWASVGIKKVIEAVGDLNEALVARLVINQSQPNTVLAEEIQVILPEFGIKSLPVEIQQRQVYRKSAAYGQTVHSLGYEAKDAITEIEALADAVLKLIGVKSKRTRLPKGRQKRQSVSKRQKSQTNQLV